MTIKEIIKKDEGLRLTPYRCPAGKLTIGYGHNLDAKGISQRVADLIFEEDYAEAEAGAKTLVSNWDELSENRQGVLINMVFNMGVDGMRKWKNTLSAIENHDYHLAAINMRLSKWATQVGSRADRLIKLMEEG